MVVDSKLIQALSTLRAKPMFEKLCPYSGLESEQVCNVIIHSDWSFSAWFVPKISLLKIICQILFRCGIVVFTVTFPSTKMVHVVVADFRRWIQLKWFANPKPTNPTGSTQPSSYPNHPTDPRGPNVYQPPLSADPGTEVPEEVHAGTIDGSAPERTCDQGSLKNTAR